MKKVVSILMAIFMLTGMLAMLAVPSAAEETTVKTRKIYISDAGDDLASGTSPEAPRKQIHNVIASFSADIGPEGNWQALEIVLVGDLTIPSGASWTRHSCPVIITSADKAQYKLILEGAFKVYGETLFTNIQIVSKAANADFWAQGNKLTMGKYGDENDVITYDSSITGSHVPDIYGNSSNAPESATKYDNGVNITINSGRYEKICAAGTYGGWIKGDVNIVINYAEVTSGYISASGYDTGSTTGVAYLCTGNTNITINGGKFINTKIILGYVNNKNSKDAGRKVFPGETQETTYAKGAYAECYFLGDITLDINGGEFSGNYTQIGKGDQIASETEMASHLHYNKSITVDLVEIKNGDKATMKGYILNLSNDNSYTVTEHDNTRAYIPVADDTTKHIKGCPCGCGATSGTAEPHTMGDWVETKAASHTENGEKVKTCTADCGYTETESIPASTDAHIYDTILKNDTSTHTEKCACGDTKQVAHTWNDGTIVTTATHTEDGTVEYVCEVCGEKNLVPYEGDKDDHSYGAWEYADDNQHKRACACGDAKYAPHQYDEGKITTEPTVDSEGVKTFTCSTCKHTKTEAVAKLPAPDTTAPTEEKKGCGSSLAASAAVIGVVALATGALIACPKKKRDND